MQRGITNFSYSKEIYNKDPFLKYLNWAIHNLDALTIIKMDYQVLKNFI